MKEGLDKNVVVDWMGIKEKRWFRASCIICICDPLREEK